jgi:hypothetical protein
VSSGRGRDLRRHALGWTLGAGCFSLGVVAFGAVVATLLGVLVTSAALLTVALWRRTRVR